MEKAAPVAGTVSVVAERNFEGVADDENVDMNVSAHKVHPRAHMGDEFDAGGAFEGAEGGREGGREEVNARRASMMTFNSLGL